MEAQRRSTHDSAMAGEFFVMEALYRLGHQPALTLGNAKSIDILVRTRKGRLIEVSVKTVRGGGKWGVGDEELRERNELLFVLLRYADFTNVAAPPDVFIIPAKEVARIREPWLESQAVYFSNAERRGRLERFQNAWHLFDR